MPRLIRSIAWASLALSMLGFTNCCPPAPATPRPEAALRAYTGHLKNKKTDQAYELLSASAKKNLGKKELRRFLVEHGERLADLLEAFFSASEVDVAVRATLRSEGGDEVHLVREKGAWRIDSGALVPPISATPEDAVQRFLLAIESRDCRALLECAPPSARASHTRKQLLSGCREQIDTLLETSAQIRAAGVKPVKVSKKRAEITYLGTAGTSRKLIMVEYRGRWYVEDLL